MTKTRLFLSSLLVVLFAVLGGWTWGHSGRSALQASLDAAELRLDLAQARAGLLDAGVDVFEMNFGNASRACEAARGPLKDAISRLKAAGRDALARRAGGSLPALREAQQLAGRVDQSANANAAGALKALDEAVAGLGAAGR
jgi:hypothetical protein